MFRQYWTKVGIMMHYKENFLKINPPKKNEKEISIFSPDPFRFSVVWGLLALFVQDVTKFWAFSNRAIDVESIYIFDSNFAFVLT